MLCWLATLMLAMLRWNVEVLLWSRGRRLTWNVLLSISSMPVGLL